MKKTIFILMVITSAIFVSCNAPTEVKTIQINGVESVNTYKFNDFFNPEELVYVSRDETSMAIVMDKNTGVIYVWKRSGYQWGMSPIYDSDGSVLTMEKSAGHKKEKRNEKIDCN